MVMAIRLREVFLAVNEGEIKAVFSEQDEVVAYINKMNCKGAKQSGAEYGYAEESWESYYQNGYDGGAYFWGGVEIPCKTSDDSEYIREHGEYINVGLQNGGGEEEFTIEEIRAAM